MFKVIIKTLGLFHNLQILCITHKNNLFCAGFRGKSAQKPRRY